MMVFSGKGYLVLAVFFLSVVLGQVLGALVPDSAKDALAGWPFAAGILVGAFGVHRLGVWLHRRDQYVDVDPITGEESFISPVHSLSGIRVQHWAYLFVVFAAFSIYANR